MNIGVGQRPEPSNPCKWWGRGARPDSYLTTRLVVYLNQDVDRVTVLTVTLTNPVGRVGRYGWGGVGVEPFWVSILVSF